jgi:hypothetical protein
MTCFITDHQTAISLKQREMDNLKEKGKFAYLHMPNRLGKKS